MQQANLEYVGFWARVGASVIDGVLLMLVMYPMLLAFYGMGYLEDTRFVKGPADFLISWVLPAVVTVWFWIARGQTPGKMVIGAKVVDAQTGEPISIGKGVVRYIGYFVSMIGLFIGYIWVGIDPQKRGWHDHIAGTVVVRKKPSVVFEGN